ncbi:MAG: winged helix-turn-helix domain-containing protein [Alphaproteobacteria bacterium]|nr:winged helix-turn-helix domain-containing protein [Alphaproteobacteria bacterium]
MAQVDFLLINLSETLYQENLTFWENHETKRLVIDRIHEIPLFLKNIEISKALVAEVTQTNTAAILQIETIRQTHPQLPVIIIGQDCNHLALSRCYLAGADIVLPKEIWPKVLVKCLRRLTDETPSQEKETAPNEPRLADWVLDHKYRQIKHHSGKVAKLTNNEVLVLGKLMHQSGQSLTRNELLSANSNLEETRRVDKIVSRLKSKIRDQITCDLPIEKVYGHGYVFAASGKVNLS